MHTQKNFRLPVTCMHGCIFQKKIRLPVTCMDAYTKKFPLAHDMHAYMPTYIIAKANL